MKKIGIVALLLVFIYFLQTVLFTALAINQIKANFIIASLVLIGFFRGEYYGLLFGAVLGFWLDLFFGSVLGPNFFLLGVIGLLAGKSYYVFSKENFMFPLLMIGLADFAYNLIIYIVFYLFRGNTDFLYFLFWIMIPEMIYTVLVGFVIYRPYLWIHQKLLTKKIEEKEYL